MNTYIIGVTFLIFYLVGLLFPKLFLDHSKESHPGVPWGLKINSKLKLSFANQA